MVSGRSVTRRFPASCWESDLALTRRHSTFIRRCNLNPDIGYTYPTPFQVVPALGDTGNLTIAVTKGGDFILRRIMGISISGGTFKVQYGDGGRSFAFQSDLVDSRLLVGTAQLWFPVPDYRFPAGGSILWRVVDTSGAANTVQLAFWGIIVPTGTPTSAGAAKTQPASAGMKGYR